MEDYVKLQCSKRRIAACGQGTSADGSSEQWWSVGSDACLLWNLELRDCWVGIWWRLLIVEARVALCAHNILRPSSRSSSRSRSKVTLNLSSKSTPISTSTSNSNSTSTQTSNSTSTPASVYERRSGTRLVEMKATIVSRQLDEGWLCQWRNCIRKGVHMTKLDMFWSRSRTTDVVHVSNSTWTTGDLYWRFVFLLSQRRCCRQAVLEGEIICKSQAYCTCHDDIASTTSAIVPVSSLTLRFWGLTSWNDFYDVFTSWSPTGRGTPRWSMNKYSRSRRRLRWHLCSSCHLSHDVRPNTKPDNEHVKTVRARLCAERDIDYVAARLLQRKHIHFMTSDTGRAQEYHDYFSTWFEFFAETLNGWRSMHSETQVVCLKRERTGRVIIVIVITRIVEILKRERVRQSKRKGVTKEYITQIS